MYSIKELYRIGNGPSSSHTIGPKNACLEFIKRHPVNDKIEVTLYGSLALTGEGHGTDRICKEILKDYNTTIFVDKLSEVPHPNTMDIKGYNGKEEYKMRFFSVGGGAIKIDGDNTPKAEIYPLNTLKEITSYCEKKGIKLWQYVDECEGKEINDFLEEVYSTMMKCVERGITTEGILPGPLKLERKAKQILERKPAYQSDFTSEFRKKLMAYAYAVAEESANGGEIVTAPTCGAAGVLPAMVRIAEDNVMGRLEKKADFNHQDIINALKTAGLIGNLIKYNGSISGAEAGCQAEIGAACSMTAAFAAQLADLSFHKISAAAEIALEHHLGLTCDPVGGYVQIPCIERNAVAVLRALDAFNLVLLLNTSRAKISFDVVVKTMLETGKDLSSKYRETSEGGLAKIFSC